MTARSVPGRSRTRPFNQDPVASGTGGGTSSTTTGPPAMGGTIRGLRPRVVMQFRAGCCRINCAVRAGRGVRTGPSHVAAAGRFTAAAPATEHLHDQLPCQPVQCPPEQTLIGEAHCLPGQRLKVLDQVVAAQAGIQVPAQEPGMRSEASEEGPLSLAARDQRAV